MDPDGVSREDAFARWAGIAYLAFAILVGLADILFILRHYPTFPFGDHWIWLARLYERGPLGAIWSQYNEHRLVFPGVLFFLDHRYFGSVNGLLIIASMLFQAGCAILLILPLWRQAEIPKPVRCVFAGFVIIAMFWFIQAENFFYVLQLVLACANLGCLATLHFFSRAAWRQDSSAHPATWLWIATLGCAFWATFSFGHGILIWPALLLTGLAVRLPGRSLLLILLAFVCAVGLYFLGYHTPAGHASPLESLRHPLRVVQYAVLMLGLPFFGVQSQDVSLFTHFGSYGITLGGILAAVAMLLRFALVKAARENREQYVYCPMLLVSLGAVFLAALGRSNFPVDQALSGRYGHIPLLFWISLAALVTADLSRRERRGGLGRAIWCALLMLASAATLSMQITMGRYMAIRSRDQAAAAMSITVGVPDTARIAEELTVPELVRYVDRFTQRALGHSLFARPEAAWIGTPLLDHFRPAPAGVCMGLVDSVNSLPEPSSPGDRLAGWAWDAGRQRPTSRIWIVDDRMIVRGLGITGKLRLDLAAVSGNRAMETAGWMAYSRPPGDGSGALTVFAELGGGESVCQIGGPHAPTP